MTMPDLCCGSGWGTDDGRCPARFIGADGDEQCLLCGDFPHPHDSLRCMVPADTWDLAIVIADAYRARMGLRPAGVEEALEEIGELARTSGRLHIGAQWVDGMLDAATILERHFPAAKEGCE